MDWTQISMSVPPNIILLFVLGLFINLPNGTKTVISFFADQGFQVGIDFFGKFEFDKLFDEIEKSKSDISMCYKLGRHLMIKKKSQDRQRVRHSIYIRTVSSLLVFSLGTFDFLLAGLGRQ